MNSDTLEAIALLQQKHPSWMLPEDPPELIDLLILLREFGKVNRILDARSRHVQGYTLDVKRSDGNHRIPFRAYTPDTTLRDVRARMWKYILAQVPEPVESVAQ